MIGYNKVLPSNLAKRKKL